MTTWEVKELDTLNDIAHERVRHLLEHESAAIVEHRHYRESRAPTLLIFEDFDLFEEYVATQTRPGDKLLVWDYGACCRDDNIVAGGKVPDAAGRVPSDGVY